MKIVIKKKKMFLEIISLLIILIVFTYGWLYLEVIFHVVQKPFDFEIYLEPKEGNVSQEDSINSTVIVFSDFNKYSPVEIYISNCPQYSTCTLSISNANPTYTSTLTIAASSLTPTGTYPINIFASGGGINKAATYFINVITKGCICEPWISQGCGGKCGSQMYVTRNCEPKGCDIESRCAYNYSCIKDFTLESIPTYSIVAEQKAFFTIKITPVNGFSGFVYLSTTSCPPGAACFYSLSPVYVPSNISVNPSLTVRTALGKALGEFTITTTAFSDKIIHTTNSTVKIN